VYYEGAGRLQFVFSHTEQVAQTDVPVAPGAGGGPAGERCQAGATEGTECADRRLSDAAEGFFVKGSEGPRTEGDLACGGLGGASHHRSIDPALVLRLAKGEGSG
jgi:hypothetical protein